MAVKQRNIFICDKCKKEERTEVEICMYSDPIVQPPRVGWGEVVMVDGEEFEVCPECRIAN